MTVPKVCSIGLLAFGAMLLPCAARGQLSSVAGDKAQRDPAIHWPTSFNPATAPVFSHNQLLIHTDCHRAWMQMTDVVAWPEWFVLTRDVKLAQPDNPLAHGSLLSLKIFGSPIMTRIDEFVPDTRLSWIPQGLDETKPSHYHTWRFVPRPEGCLVETEESGIGANDYAAPEKVGRLMHKAHELWLDSLQFRTEP